MRKSAAREQPMATQTIQIRPLNYAELPQVISIERRAFSCPWSLAMFVLELSKPSSICLAAHADGRLVGYLVCSRFADTWHLMNIATDPEFRRRGAGRQLLEALLEQAGPGASYTLEVRRSNHGAINLYESFGFRSAGIRPRYYQDNGEDAVIMWRGESFLGSGA
jgi:ribosomal-protein-alanine N-acetyltransferase